MARRREDGHGSPDSPRELIRQSVDHITNPIDAFLTAYAEVQATAPAMYEPDAATVIDELLKRYIEALVYQAVAENMASEQSARMVAMKAATDNAGTLIGELKLVYNKTRQAAITKELSEIVSGAAAISG